MCVLPATSQQNQGSEEYNAKQYSFDTTQIKYEYFTQFLLWFTLKQVDSPCMHATAADVMIIGGTVLYLPNLVLYPQPE